MTADLPNEANIAIIGCGIAYHLGRSTRKMTGIIRLGRPSPARAAGAA